MDFYVLWKDLLTAYHASPDWIKAVWLLIPPAFLLILIGMVMRYRIASKKQQQQPEPEYFVPSHNDRHTTPPLLKQTPTDPQPWV